MKKKPPGGAKPSLKSVQRMLVQDLHNHSYKLQIVQELKHNGHLVRRQFCERMLDIIYEDNEAVSNRWMSDKGHFYLNGFVNKRSFHYWAHENLTQLHQSRTATKLPCGVLFHRMA